MNTVNQSQIQIGKDYKNKLTDRIVKPMRIIENMFPDFPPVVEIKIVGEEQTSFVTIENFLWYFELTHFSVLLSSSEQSKEMDRLHAIANTFSNNYIITPLSVEDVIKLEIETTQINKLIITTKYKVSSNHDEPSSFQFLITFPEPINLLVAR